jgi:hypothetical protein
VSSRNTGQDICTPVRQTVYKADIFEAFPPDYKVITHSGKNKTSRAPFMPEDFAVPGFPQPPKDSKQYKRPNALI